MRYLCSFFVLLFFSMAPSAALAGDPVLTIETQDGTTKFTAAQLLARKDRASVAIAADVSYKRPMTYAAAVPALSLLPESSFKDNDTVEARATDGFASQIPLKLFKEAAAGGSIPWIAIEDPKTPWPKVPGKSFSAGPFYLVWQHPKRSNVSTEYWPYALSALKLVESPTKRWPQMAIADDVPKDAPLRRGLEHFTRICMSCHKIDGAGQADMGPDLARPMSPTEYMSPEALRKLIRDPASVRTWPDQKMPGYGPEILSDSALEDLIVYLSYIAERVRER